jgi:hypothetical protein
VVRSDSLIIVQISELPHVPLLTDQIRRHAPNRLRHDFPLRDIIVQLIRPLVVPLLMASMVAGIAGAQASSFSLHAEVGGAFAQGGGYANNGGLAGRLGLGLAATRGVVVELEAGGFLIPNGTLCADVGPASCPPDFPRIGEVMAEIRFSAGRSTLLDRLTFGFGAGAARVSGGQIVSETRPVFSVAADYAVLEWTRVILSAGVRGEAVSNTKRGTLTMVPITLGLRLR